jgi:hypothetical protein
MGEVERDTRVPAGARPASAVALAGLALLVAPVLWLASGPLTTNDLWWHLAHGRAYAEHGPWPATDPCLFTAERGPIPHQWLFALAAHGVELAVGLHGLRVVHALALLAIVWLAWSVFRSEAGRTAPACLAAAVFLVLGWYRLVQLRPELFSIAAVLLLHRWLFAPPFPGWGGVAASVALVAVWANVHAAFAIGPLLVAAALCGVAVRAIVAARWGAGDARLERRRAQRLAAALGLGLLAALANPRGAAQHLTFATASAGSALRGVVDEWAPFDPFEHTNYAPAVSGLAWVSADLVLLVFAALAATGAARFFAAPSRGRLDACDPVRFALGLAGAVALLASIRFLWLGAFPLVFALHALRDTRARLADAGFAAATVALAVLYPLAGGFAAAAALQPRELHAWISDPYTSRRFFAEGVRFLGETGVTGNLFHTYGMGGFLCHRLAPRLRTFVDGSLNVPEDVLFDYANVNAGRGTRAGEGPRDVLERRGIDVFFGVGVPAGGDLSDEEGIFTTASLDGAPGWLLVSRSLRHSISVRANARNAENLRRVADWYAAQGVPFDPGRGLDPAAVIRARPDWAEANGMVPRGFASLGRDAEAPGPRRVASLETLGLAYALAGAYPEQVEIDRVAVALRPRAKAPRRRLVYGLLRLGRVGEAQQEARALVALDPGDPRSQAFARAAERPTPAAIEGLPLLSSRNPLRQ